MGCGLTRRPGTFRKRVSALIPSLSRRGLLRVGIGVPAAAASGLVTGKGWSSHFSSWQQMEQIARSIREPVIPARRFVVTDFGAAGDGLTLNTAAIARAIDACAKAGGGRVEVPAGRFLTGAIRLRSRVELHLSAHAILLFSTDPTDYPNVLTRWEGVELINHSPLIYAYQESHVALTGSGVVDGQGSAANWWSWSGGPQFGWREAMPSQRAARESLFRMAEAGVPVERRIFGEGHFLRPPAVQFNQCKTILVEGIRIRNAPFWSLHPVQCRDVTVRGIEVVGHGPNTDGCDPESVSGMVIEGSIFDTGDDCIAIKSGRNADGRRLHVPSQDILIRDCHMKAGHGGVVIGSEISGGVRNVFAERLHMDSPDLWSAIRFKSNAMRGGRLEHFRFRDIDVGQVSVAAIVCDLRYEEGANGPFLPVLRDVSIENMRVARTHRVLDCRGLPTAPVNDLQLRHCRFNGVDEISTIENARNFRLRSIQVNDQPVTKL